MKTILVENLSPDVTCHELQSMFESYGQIIGVDVVAAQDFGYVRMADDSEAYRAIRGLDGELCSGRKLKVALAQAYSRRKREPAAVGVM